MGKLVEGLWDCPYCDTTSIKASQKTCPNCGHPQDENTVFRMPDTISYVSDEDAAKISQNPDWQCSFCGSLNKDIDNSCNNCGASKEESEKNYFEMRRERDEKSNKKQNMAVKAIDKSSDNCISKSKGDKIIWNFDWGGSTNKRFAPRYEFVFWFVKDKNNYTFNLDDVKIPVLNYRPDRYKSQLRNPTDVWRMSMVSGNFQERTAHPAQYPEQLIERIILTGSNPGDIIMDPFMGSGTTAVVAKKLGRHYLGYEIVKDYCDIANERLSKVEDKNGI